MAPIEEVARRDEVVERRAVALERWRRVALAAAVVLPAALLALFSRQAARLDELAAHGVSTYATVSAVLNDGRITEYAYVAEGRTHASSVARDEAPGEVGASFPIVYSPSDPTLSLPIEDPREATHAADRARMVGVAVAAVVFALAGVFAWALGRDLARLRSGAPARPLEPAEYRRRIARSAAVLALLVAPIVGFHARDALSRGESLVPIVVAALLVAAIITGILVSAALRGPDWAVRQARRFVPIAAAIGMAIAALRMLAIVLFGS